MQAESEAVVNDSTERLRDVAAVTMWGEDGLGSWYERGPWEQEEQRGWQ